MSGNKSNFMHLAHKQMLSVDALVESIIYDPWENVVSCMNSFLAILDTLEYGATPYSMSFNPIFICSLSVRRFVLGQSFGSNVNVMIVRRFVKEFIFTQWFEHAWVTHQELECIGQLRTQ